MKRVCIFDLDGTLTDTLESITYCVNLTLQELGLPEITREQCRAFVGNGARFLIEESLRAAGDTEISQIERAMEVYGRIFGRHCTYRVEPYEGIEDLLADLKSQGLKLAVLSNKPDAQTKDVVAKFFGSDIFNYIQGQCEGIPRKPDPAAAQWIAKEFGVDTEECIYIGDSEVDMLTARAAGMESVGVTWGFRTEEVLQKHGATHIIHHPRELLTIIREKGV
ncbi:MAG: HAD family hydrolase [Faecalimonas sp.]|nr:HAD family hydrolase [Faecalimonas sp.]